MKVQGGEARVVEGTEQASCKHQTQQHPEATDATEGLNRALGYRTDRPVQAGGRRTGHVSQRFTLLLKRSPRRQGRNCQRTLWYLSDAEAQHIPSDPQFPQIGSSEFLKGREQVILKSMQKIFFSISIVVYVHMS